MPKTLLILRHAKSSWKEPNLTDYQRPLNSRGLSDAPRMGQLLIEQNLIPDLIVASSASRANTTAALIAQECNCIDRIVPYKELYLAAPETHVRVLQEQNNDDSTIMIVAHNPGVEQLVYDLTGHEEAMPTAALAVVLLPIDRWADLALSVDGELLAVWRPKELV